LLSSRYELAQAKQLVDRAYTAPYILANPRFCSDDEAAFLELRQQLGHAQWPASAMCPGKPFEVYEKQRAAAEGERRLLAHPAAAGEETLANELTLALQFASEGKTLVASRHPSSRAGVTPGG